MVAAGIPADRILEEHRAMNTGENVILSLPIIDAALGLQNVRSVICRGNTWTEARGRSFRGDHRIAVYRDGERSDRGELTLDEAAKRLEVSKMTVLRLIRSGPSRPGRPARERLGSFLNRRSLIPL